MERPKGYKKEYLNNKKCQQLPNNFNSVVAGIFFNYMSLQKNNKKCNNDIIKRKGTGTMKKYLRLLSTKTKLKCSGVIFLAFISSMLASLWPVRLGQLYTSIANKEYSALSQCFRAVTIFGLIYLSAECIAIFRRVMLDCIIASHEAEIREKSIEKLLKMPVSYYGGKLSGEGTAQLNQGVSGLSQLIKICCNDIIATVLTAICTLFQVVTNAPVVIGGIIMLYLCATVLISILQIRSQNGIREKIISQKNTLDGQICQSISNLEFIRSLNAGEYEKNRLKPSIIKISTVEKKHHRYMGAFDCAKQFCKIVFQVFILAISVLMIARGTMAPGSVITVCLLFQQLIKPIDEVYRFMDETAASIVKAKALGEVVSVQSDVAYSIEAGIKAPVVNEISFSDVTIAEPSGSRDIAVYDKLYIPTDSVVAVTGDSGCGKTTLMRCLTRYYPHSKESHMSLWGREFDAYSQEELTKMLLYLPQKTFFFAGSIRENLRYALPDSICDEELILALRQACLYDTLADKIAESNVRSDKIESEILDYQIGEGGSGLSGGEGQRLSLARAFLRKPRVFVFDESMTGLDSNTAAKVLFNMEEYANKIGAGIIHISHEERVVNRCKYVIKLNNKLKFETDTLEEIA